MLRPGETYLSTNWLEYFDPVNRSRQIDGVRQTLVDKGRTVARSAYFAVLNVGLSIEMCQQESNLPVQFINLGESRDPSHTGIFGLVNTPSLAAHTLAESVNPNEVYPATP